jgi:hypothetical protein
MRDLVYNIGLLLPRLPVKPSFVERLLTCIFDPSANIPDMLYNREGSRAQRLLLEADGISKGECGCSTKSGS